MMGVTTQEVDFGKREINYSFIICPLSKLILTGNFGTLLRIWKFLHNYLLGVELVPFFVLKELLRKIIN